MKALVTGAGGFVGANLVAHLARSGHEPVAVVRPAGDRWRLGELNGSVATVELDLRDTDAIDRMVRTQRPDVIYHMAAHGAYSWQSDLPAMLSVNVQATQALLMSAEAVGARLVNAGSSSEYGYKDHAPLEDELLEPNSHYAVTKAAATHLCRLAAATTGQYAITLRLYSVYGTWEEPGRLIPTLVQRGLQGRLPPLVNPATARDFVWVEDACEAFLAAAAITPEDPGPIFNIASGTQTSLAQLVDLVRNLLGIAAEPEWGTMAARDWDTSAWVGDPAYAADRLEWRAHTPLDRGLAKLIDWFRARRSVAARYAA